MAIAVNFYSFAKKENSTKRPTAIDISRSCTLKNDCGIVAPRIELLESQSFNPRHYNYCYISHFDRYYFIREWTYSDRKWIAELVEDVLASWRDSIGAASEFVLRSSVSTAIDEKITDTLFPAQSKTYTASTGKVLNNQQATTPDFGLGQFVVGVVNNANSASGISYYLMGGAEMSQLRAFMLDSGVTSWDSIKSIGDDIAKALLDPFQYITSCMWFPYTYMPITTGAAQTLSFGFWDTDITVQPILSYNFAYTGTLERPTSPVNMRGEYNYHAPYASYQVEYLPFGNIPIPDAQLSLYGVYVNVKVDIITGEGLCRIYELSGNSIVGGLLAERTAQIGVPVAIAQQSIDIGGAVSGIVSAGSAVGHGFFGNIGGAISSAITAAGELASSVAPVVQASGGGKGLAMVTEPMCSLTAFYSYIPNTDVTNSGAPCCKVYTLSAIPGYIKCLHGDIKMAGNLEECRRVKSYLESGFFYE